MAAVPSYRCLNPNLTPEIRRLKAAGARPPLLHRRRANSIWSDLSANLFSERYGGNGIRVPQVPLAPSTASAAQAVSFSPRRSKRNVLLFYCEEMRELAERVAGNSDTIELRSINWRTFEDGFPNLFIPNAHGIRGEHVAFLASFSSPEVIFGQISIIYALPSLFISSFTLVLPYFPTGTSERMEEEGDVATAYTLARILSNTPISRGGPTSLVIFDIHALQERFYFGDSVLPCFESGVPLLKNRLQQLPDSDNMMDHGNASINNFNISQW